MISFGEKISGEKISAEKMSWKKTSQLRRILLTTFISFVFSATSWALPKIPDEEKTPGSICNKETVDFVEYRYSEKIPYCFRNVTVTTKAKIYDKYKIPVNCRNHYTIDHLIPLSVGGDNSPANLWPEHKLIKAQRPNVEIELYQAIKEGEITQREAVEYIVTEKKTFNGNIDNEADSDCDKDI